LNGASFDSVEHHVGITGLFGCRAPITRVIKAVPDVTTYNVLVGPLTAAYQYLLVVNSTVGGEEREVIQTTFLQRTFDFSCY